MRLVVTDTGPLVHLGEIGARDLLPSLGEIRIPESVAGEIATLDKGWPSARPRWVHVAPLDEAHEAESRAWEDAGLLDRGEADAIALARQLDAKWFLTDDASARLMAEALGIEAHGSLGVVLWAAAERTLTRDEAEDKLTRLAHSSLWVSQRVLAEARAALDKLLA